MHSFQDKELLRIGVRDLLGMDTIRATTLELSNLAETLLVEIAHQVEAKMMKRFGIPVLSEEGRSNETSRYVILALGKLGGREMSYHSDLDLVLVYEGEGYTVPPPNKEALTIIQRVDAAHYFTELAQRIIKASSQTGPMGRLYEVDMKLRPTGKSGRLVIPLEEFRRYYGGNAAQVWERQSLTRTRVVHGDPAFGEAVMSVVREAIEQVPWSGAIVDDIMNMRQRLEASASRGASNAARAGS